MIGIDPGYHRAGWARVVDYVLTDWRALRTVGKSGKTRVIWPGGELVCPTWHEAVAAFVSDQSGQACVVEATPAFTRAKSRGGQAHRALVVQAEAAGAIAYAARAVDRVEPTTWRPAVLAISGTDPRAALAAEGLWGWRRIRRTGPRPPVEVSTSVPRPPEWAAPHIAEAACIALWGQTG